jgi:Mn2+/Fe2+ NRAMP family transporter
MSSETRNELETLRDARARGAVATTLAYLRLSGPGFLQSAITLGGGSLASSLFLGVLGGFTLLWLQPLAIALGAVMLAAIAHVTLATGRRPLELVNRELNPVLGYGWAIASLVASMVWAMPQFALATSVVEQNLLPSLFGPNGALSGTPGRALIVVTLAVSMLAVTSSYGRGSQGVARYERVLKIMVAAIVLCFLGVTIQLATATDGIDVGAIAGGFVPDPSATHRPAAGFDSLLTAVSTDARGWWSAQIVEMQRQVMVSAAATAVGINMTFLLPCTLLRRQWTRAHGGLARTDLLLGMLLPFVLATSCVVIAAADRFHAKPIEALLSSDSGEVSAGTRADFDRLLAARANSFTPPIEPSALPHEEKRVAAALAKRDAFDLAKALSPLTGETFCNLVFGLGVLGMALSTATLLMLICGQVLAEIFGWSMNSRAARNATLLGAVGAIGPFVWSKAGFWLAVPTSMFGMVLLPIAYWTFLLLMNRPRILGDAMPRGGARWAWNCLMIPATLLATMASAYSVKSQGGTPWVVVAIAYVALAIVVGIRRSRSVT